MEISSENYEKLIIKIQSLEGDLYMYKKWIKDLQRENKNLRTRLHKANMDLRSIQAFAEDQMTLFD